MIKHCCLILTVVCFSHVLYGQKIRLDLNVSGQLHDKRSSISGSLTKHWSEYLFGTKSFNLALNYLIIDKQNFNISAGLGIFYQTTTTFSGFNSNLVGRPPKFQGIESITRYGKRGLIAPISFSYYLDNKWLLGSDIINQFVLQRAFINTRDLSSNAVDLSVNTFDYEQAEINIWAGRKINHFDILLSLRVLRVAKVDRYIFFEEYFDGYATKPSDIYLKKIDFYNPLKIGLTIRYEI